jgi:hypothetical protein
MNLEASYQVKFDDLGYVCFWKLFFKLLCVYLLLKKLVNGKYFSVKKI